MNDMYELRHDESLVDSALPCPACGELFYYRKQIEIKSAKPVNITLKDNPLSTDLTPDQQEAIIQIAAERKIYAATTALRELLCGNREAFENFSSSPTFGCPNCGVALQIKFQMAVIGVETVGGAFTKRKPRQPVESLPESDRKLYRKWSEMGLLDAFFEAAAVDNPGMGLARTPASRFRVFKNWLLLALAIEIPRKQLARFITEYDSAEIDCFHSNGVAAILAGGKIRCLLPKSVVMGEFTKEKLQINGNGKQLVGTRDLDGWVKTRWGYTVGHGLFFQALQQECVGAYGSATKTQRQTESGLPRYEDGDDSER